MCEEKKMLPWPSYLHKNAQEENGPLFALPNSHSPLQFLLYKFPIFKGASPTYFLNITC